MCGIVVAWDSTFDPIHIAHRGLRSKTIESMGWKMHHVRLPIVGIEEEYDQPYVDNEFTMGFVGEVLDFREHYRWMKCDLNLVADQWSKKGPWCLASHDGFWHVAVISHKTGQLHLLCDYLAQKPMYYRTDHPSAASEPNVLARMFPVTPDVLYLSDVIKWGYCPDSSRTPYAEIKKMLPGEHVVMTSSGYVEREIVDHIVPRAVNPQYLKDLIEAAVRRRVMSSDVPVACLVSGGLDSAITYTLAKRYGDVRAYHAENEEFEECLQVAPDAEQVPIDFVSYDKALDYMQEPIDLGSLRPQTALSDAIAGAGSERVCLTGDGADELFGGYQRSLRYDSQASDVWRELVNWHLPRLDRVMMRNRIEVRSPFLSRNVVEAALALPRKSRTNKRILRDLFAGDLPPRVSERPKWPLKTKEVERDREGVSRELVNLFTKKMGLEGRYA